MGLFATIAKWALIGTGTVLSLIPAVGPLIGTGIVAAGLAVKTSTTSVDKVSNNAAILANVLQTSTAMNAVAAGSSVINVNPLLDFLKKYWLYIVGGLAALFLLPKFFKRS